MHAILGLSLRVATRFPEKQRSLETSPFEMSVGNKPCEVSRGLLLVESVGHTAHTARGLQIFAARFPARLIVGIGSPRSWEATETVQKLRQTPKVIRGWRNKLRSLEGIHQ